MCTTSFFLFCRENRFDLIEEILNDKDNRNKLLNLRDSNGRNCLLWAAEHNNVEAVKYLLTFKNLDVNVLHIMNFTTLLTAVTACKLCSVEMVETLCKSNEGLINRCADNGYSPLIMAVNLVNLKVFKKLVELGAEVNHRDFNGRNVLHEAANRGRLDIIHYLRYETLCDSYTPDKHGFLPAGLFLLTLLGRQRRIKQLFHFGLDFLSMSQHKELEESFHVHRLLIQCFKIKDDRFMGPLARWHFQEMVENVFVIYPRRHLVEKIMAAKLKDYLCLISLLVLKQFRRDLNYTVSDDSTKRSCVADFENLKLSFLEELFPLFVKDKALANEYVEEIVRIGWRFCSYGILSRLSTLTSNKPSVETLCNFKKMLLYHGLDDIGIDKPAPSSMFLECKHMTNVLEPEDPSCAVELSRSSSDICVNAYAGSINRLFDFYILHDQRNVLQEVFTLQHLSRMSLRKYAFREYRPQTAIAFLNSLNIPNDIKNYLNYNY